MIAFAHNNRAWTLDDGPTIRKIKYLTLSVDGEKIGLIRTDLILSLLNIDQLKCKYAHPMSVKHSKMMNFSVEEKDFETEQKKLNG